MPTHGAGGTKILNLNQTAYNVRLPQTGRGLHVDRTVEAFLPDLC